MASGNFLIGNDLSLRGFNQYVQSFLEKKGYSVEDKLSVPYQTNRKSILISVVGKKDLETELDKMLVEIGKIIDKTEISSKKPKKLEDHYPVARKHQVSFSHLEKKEGQEDISVEKGLYETIGIYQDNNTASQLFPSIAQKYLLDGIEQKAEEVVEEIKSLLD
jgi:hypothetical protein